VAFGVVALCEVLLVLTAGLKLAAPSAATDALGQVGLRVGVGVVRLGAAAELVAGAGALITGWPVFTAGVALSYAVFAAFVALALGRAQPVSSCGCFGSPGATQATPPTVAHLVFDLAAAAICLIAALWPRPGVVTALRHQPLAGVPLVALVALGCWLSWILLAVAPQTAAAITTPTATTGRRG
jgi:hypothetical protein